MTKKSFAVVSEDGLKVVKICIFQNCSKMNFWELGIGIRYTHTISKQSLCSETTHFIVFIHFDYSLSLALRTADYLLPDVKRLDEHFNFRAAEALFLA